MVENNKKMVVYKADDGGIELRHDPEKETIVASLNQIADIFGVGKAAVSKHLKNIFSSGELSKKATVSKMETVRLEGKRKIKRAIDIYNLDAIVAVGYRVNSKRATHFRVWATDILKKYLVKGYAVNEKRLRQARLKDFEKTVSLFRRIMNEKRLSLKESEGLLRVITDYADSWAILEKYDKGELKREANAKEKKKIEYERSMEEILSLRSDLMKKGQASEIFGLERERSFKAVVGNIYQTFGKKELYPSLEEKAAYLLYFTIKDHPFSDGNKRIGCFLFVLFLMKNKYLYSKKGEKKFNSNALVALALLVAESKPKEKDLMVDLIINLISGK